MSGPRGGYDYFRPTPPQRGSFPIDHNGDCTQFMDSYLNCIKSTKGTNAPGCRMLAKNYLNCRMENDLMDKDEWKNLGLPDDSSEASSITGAPPPSQPQSQDMQSTSK